MRLNYLCCARRTNINILCLWNSESKTLDSLWTNAPIFYVFKTVRGTLWRLAHCLAWQYVIFSFLFALLSMFCAITTYLARPVIARRFFITGLLTSAYSWLYFTLVCDTHFCTHPNPIPWGVPVFWNTLYPLAHEDWYRQELASLVVKHTEIILIPSVIILLTFAADRAGHNNKALENSPALDLKLKLAIILSTLLLSAAAIWITMGMGTRAEDNYVVLANCSIPAGKILAKSDLFVFDPIF